MKCPCSGSQNGSQPGGAKRCIIHGKNLGFTALLTPRSGGLKSFCLGPSGAVSARPGPDRLGSARFGSARPRPARLGSARPGPARLGSARFGAQIPAQVPGPNLLNFLTPRSGGELVRIGRCHICVRVCVCVERDWDSEIPISGLSSIFIDSHIYIYIYIYIIRLIVLDFLC